MKSETPLVSIWSITYNHARFIKDCLEGVLSQKTNFKYELIIGDDASTDGTSEILREYAAKYPEIIRPIFHKSNVGIYKNSIETVLPELKGKYIAICEGDDYWTDPYKLQKQVDFLEGNEGYNGCAHNVNVLTNKNVCDIHPGLLENDLLMENILFDRDYNFIPTCSIVFRNNCFTIDELVFFNDFGDWPLLYLLCKNSKLKFLQDSMGIYRKHEGGYTTINKESMLLKIIKFYYEISFLHPEYKKECLVKIGELESKILIERNSLIKVLRSKKYLSVNLGYREILKILISKVKTPKA